MPDLERTCSACGSDFLSHAVVCAYCGGNLQDKKKTGSKGSERRFNLWLAGSTAVISLLIGGYLGLSGLLPNASKSPTPASTYSEAPQSSPTEIQPDLEPPSDKNVSSAQTFSNLVISPWEFLRNPFRHQGELVRLDFESLAITSNDRLIHESRCTITAECELAGRFSLHFSRMIEPGSLLYSVFGIDASGTMNPEKIGELIVNTGLQHVELSMTRDWIVRPTLPTTGTNQYGATITVPTVSFVRFATTDESRRTHGLLNPSGTE